MGKEYEVRFLDVDIDSFEKKLLQLGFKCDYKKKFFRATTFWTTSNNPREFVRIREEGGKTNIILKKTKKGSSSSEEIGENTLESYENAIELFKATGLPMKFKLEKYRTHYIRGDEIVDIDYNPTIPPYVEVETLSQEALLKLCKELGLDYNKAMKGDARDILLHYGIDVEKIPELLFSKN